MRNPYHARRGAESGEDDGMAKLKPGTRLRSAVCATEVMVVAAPDADVELRCGGTPMLGLGEEPPGGLALAADASDGTQLGKRYVNEAGGLEVLCTKPGEGSLAAGGAPLAIKGAKPLPSSD
jgi:hypothetical protein